MAPRVLLRTRTSSGTENTTPCFDVAGGLLRAIQVAARCTRELETWSDVRVREDFAEKV
jgi:hypothetical protein